METIWNMLDRKQRLYIMSSLAVWLVVVFLYAAFWWAIPLSYGQVLVIYFIGALIYGHIYLGK